MTEKKFSTGAFAFTHTAGLEPRDPAEVIALAQARGIPENVVPQYAGDRASVMRAIQRTAVSVARDGVLLRPIKRTADEVVYGIVNEHRDEAEERLDHSFASTVRWSAEPDPALVLGDHAVARRVCDAYAGLRGKIVADDWSASIVARLLALGVAPMRADGRVYWVPPQRLDDVRQLGAFLHEVGIDLVLCEIEPETRTVVESVASASLDEELERLEVEAREFDGKQKPSTYERRLEEYQQLRQRAGLYRDALGIGVERAEQVLTALAHKVEAMLDVRLQTTVHRDGRVEEKVASATSESTPTSPALVFGGVRFVRVDGSVDGAVQGFRAASVPGAVAAALESVLARWTPAGPGQLCWLGKGESASLCLRGAPLADCASGLRALGFEIV